MNNEKPLPDGVHRINECIAEFFQNYNQRKNRRREPPMKRKNESIKTRKLLFEKENCDDRKQKNRN